MLPVTEGDAVSEFVAQVDMLGEPDKLGESDAEPEEEGLSKFESTTPA